MITRSSWPIDTVGVEARPFYIKFRAVNPVIWLHWASLLETSPKKTPHYFRRAGAFFAPVQSEGIMRLQPFTGGAMLVLLFGLGVWVALQYVPMHLHQIVRW